MINRTFICVTSPEGREIWIRASDIRIVEEILLGTGFGGRGLLPATNIIAEGGEERACLEPCITVLERVREALDPQEVPSTDSPPGSEPDRTLTLTLSPGRERGPESEDSV